MASDEPNAGGLYQFAEPRLREQFIPRMSDPKRTVRIIPVVRGWDEQMRAIQTAPPIPAERFAELREAALRMGQEIADEAAGD